MHREKWMDVSTTLEADLAASVVVPGNEILDGHVVFLLQSSDFSRGQGRRGSPVGDLKVSRRGQAAALPSICRTFEADEPSIEIRRGFMASGISRTSCVCSRPCCRA